MSRGSNRAKEGAGRMPWLREAKKDVDGCDKPGRDANGF